MFGPRNVTLLIHHKAATSSAAQFREKPGNGSGQSRATIAVKESKPHSGISKNASEGQKGNAGDPYPGGNLGISVAALQTQRSKILEQQESRQAGGGESAKAGSNNKGSSKAMPMAQSKGEIRLNSVQLGTCLGDVVKSLNSMCTCRSTKYFPDHRCDALARWRSGHRRRVHKNEVHVH